MSLITLSLLALRRMPWGLLTLLLVQLAPAQTQLNLGKQAKNADFSQFTVTRPWRVVTTLPTTCLAGEAAFLSTALAGQQMHLCFPDNAWNMFTSSSGAATDFLDFSPIKTADSQLTIGPYCAAGRPCRARLGETLVSLAGAAILTLSGTSSTGTVFTWLDSQGLRAGTSEPGTSLSCNEFCTVVPGTTTTFPAGSLPIAAVPYAGNVFSLVSGTMDYRSLVSAQRITSGPTGNLTVTANLTGGAAEVDLADVLDFGGFSATRVLKRGAAASRPSTCQPGDLYQQTGTGAGIYHCPSPNQWVGPLLEKAGTAWIENRVSQTGATGDLAAVTVAPAGHSAGVLRLCAIVSVTTPAAAAPNLTFTASWRSTVSGTDRSTNLLDFEITTPVEAQACRILRTTGESAILVNPSDAGLAVYTYDFTIERLQ